MKSIAFAVMMALCGVVDAKADDTAEQMTRFANLDSYNLCYETQMAEYNGDKVSFVMGMYEMADRGLSPMDKDCFEGRADFFSEMESIEESLDGYEG